MALEKQEKLQGISKALVDNGSLSTDDIQKYIAKARIKNISLAKYLIDNKIISGLSIALIVSKDFGVPMIDINYIDKLEFHLRIVSHHLLLYPLNKKVILF